MPFRFVCSRCGHVLYESREPLPALLVAARYQYRCPACGAPLSRGPRRIRITPARRRGAITAEEKRPKT